jgi:hypothetical protein
MGQIKQSFIPRQQRIDERNKNIVAYSLIAVMIAINFIVAVIML